MTQEFKDNLEKAINASGFPFEQYVSKVLLHHGWTIIPNRYYIDDIKGVEREIDILAYKILDDKKENICYYTTLIISCKKSDSSKWCFLTRDVDKLDVNVNYFPFHYLSDDERLINITESQIAKIEASYRKEREVKAVYDFPKTIVSYQIFDDSKQKKEFQKNEAIYDSVITTIKALESEKSNLLSQRRKSNNNKRHRFYSFYLLSLFDGDMVECNFRADNSVLINEINSINYLNRHIVNKRESFYAIQFIKKNEFENKLSEYDALAEYNNTLFPSLLTSFYTDIFNEPDRVKIFWKEFVSSTEWAISLSLRKHLGNQVSAQIEDYLLDDDILKLEISKEIDYSAYSVLNDNNSAAYKSVKAALHKFFRYDGKFKFDISLPF